LEETVGSFKKDYEKIIKKREGDGWRNRYEKHFKRLTNPDLQLMVNTRGEINFNGPDGVLIQLDKLEVD